MSDSQKLIDYAQTYLQKQPFDIVHDLEHHQLVVTNCTGIVTAERLTPNMEVLMTAAWWHDVDKSYETANSSDNTVVFFRKVAADLGVDDTFIDHCVHTIEEHSFSNTQTCLESQILFDADKIEYVNVNRINKLVMDIKAHPEKYQQERLQTMHAIWISRITKVHQMMHFAYSKKVFLSQLKETKQVLEKFKQVVEAL